MLNPSSRALERDQENGNSDGNSNSPSEILCTFAFSTRTELSLCCTATLSILIMFIFNEMLRRCDEFLLSSGSQSKVISRFCYSRLRRPSLAPIAARFTLLYYKYPTRLGIRLKDFSKRNENFRLLLQSKWIIGVSSASRFSN